MVLLANERKPQNWWETNEPQNETVAAQVRQDTENAKEQGTAFDEWEILKGQGIKIHTVEELNHLLSAAN